MDTAYTSAEKERLFDLIAENYFNRNFGSMSKADFETLIFSEYLEHRLNNGLPYDDYTVSKELGLTQDRIRKLKERKELKYPRAGFDWKENFVKSLENAKLDRSDNYIKVIIQDVNVMNEIRNYVESNGWYDETSLNKKLLRLPLGCLADILLDEKSELVFSKETKDRIKKWEKDSHRDDPSLSNFIKDFTKDGFKSFLSNATGELIKSVVSLIPFGGIAASAFESISKLF